MATQTNDPSAVPGAGVKGNCAVEPTTHPTHTPANEREQQDESRLDGPGDSVNDTVHRGQQAWIRLRSDNTWVDWVDVGKAHVIGRQEAMRLAHVNEPSGHRYKDHFGAWLNRFGFHDLDDGDRSRLFKVIDNLAAIEAWRATLTTTQRLKLNHPSTVLRKWQASATVPTATDGERKPSLTEKLEQSVIALEEENTRASGKAPEGSTAQSLRTRLCRADCRGQSRMLERSRMAGKHLAGKTDKRTNTGQETDMSGGQTDRTGQGSIRTRPFVRVPSARWLYFSPMGSCSRLLAHRST
jgi:hypothetical protein